MFDFKVFDRQADVLESTSTSAHLEVDGLVYSVAFGSNIRHNSAIISSIVTERDYGYHHKSGNVHGFQCGFNFSSNF